MGKIEPRGGWFGREEEEVMEVARTRVISLMRTVTRASEIFRRILFPPRSIDPFHHIAEIAVSFHSNFVHRRDELVSSRVQILGSSSGIHPNISVTVCYMRIHVYC